MDSGENQPTYPTARELPEAWQVDAEDALLHPPLDPGAELDPDPPSVSAATPRSARHIPYAEAPPPVEQIVEALLFVGGPPLSATHARSAVRGLNAERLQAAIEGLNRKYRAQGRPYAIRASADGYTLAVKPAFRAVRDRLFGGPREARLSQPALDVLALVAYRQPVGKGEIDTVRGADSGSVLRQLVRLGLVAVVQRGDAGRRDVAYGTTPRFLDLFGLSSPDDLPRLGDTQAL
ncbi:MAG TPA: SMC-Scp complex subunit ScpB [Fimbriiglobus sp.]|jgi:segregation and condensation protein B